MTNLWKRLFCIALCLCLAAGFLPMPVRAETAPAAESARSGLIWPSKLAWSLDDEGTLTVSGRGPMPPLGDCNPIPWAAFQDQIRKVVVEEGVTSIGARAFLDCDSLAEVVLPDSVTEIGFKAFMNCTRLTTVRMPAHISLIEESAFYFCTRLRNVDLGDSLVSIGRNAFDCCYELHKLVLPATLMTLGGYAFRACNGLEEIWFMGEMPSFGNDLVFSGVTADCYYPQDSLQWASSTPRLGGDLTWKTHNGTVSGYQPATSGQCGDNLTWQLTAQGALIIQGTGDMWDYSTTDEPGWRYENVTSLILSDGVTSVGDYAMYYCDGLAAVSFPGTLTRIGSHAFYEMEALQSLPLPESLTSIGEKAFYRCSGLTTLTVPDSVTEIGEGAFERCYNVISLKLGSGITTIDKDAFNCWSALEQVTLPDSITSIGEQAFYACEKLTRIQIPDSVTELGKNAFGYCSSLTSVVLGSGVPYIPNECFYGCTSLTDVTIRGPITGVYGDAFYDCDSLVSIRLPASVEVFYSPFTDCNSLTAVIIDPANPNFCSVEGVVYTRDLSELLCYPAAKSGFFTVPFPVDSIADRAFSGCTGLTGIDLANVSDIGDAAFSDCTGLTSVVLPINLESVGSRVFQDCAALSVIQFQGDIPHISTDAFDYICAWCYFPKDYGRWAGRTNLDVGGYDGELTWFPVDNGHIHSFTVEHVDSGDCQVPDREVYTCDCGVSYAVQKYYTVEEHWVSGWWQNSDGTESQTCYMCQKTWTRPIGSGSESHIHSYVPQVIAPTCTQQGYTVWACDCCDSYLADFLPKASHTFGQWTAIEDGFGFRTCQDCGLQEYRPFSGDCGDSLTWHLEGDTLVISGEGQMWDMAGDTPWNISSFTAVRIGEGCVDIGSDAFAGSTTLEVVQIPSTVTYIDPSAFRGSTAILRYEVAEANPTFCSRNGVLYSRNMTRLVRFPAGRGGRFPVPGSVAVIEPAAFESCGQLTEVLFPAFTGAELTEIGGSAFRGCGNLSRISLPSSPTRIGNEAFANCTNLHEINFGSGLPGFGSDVFKNMAFLHITFSTPYAYDWSRFMGQFNNWTGVLGAYNVTWEEIHEVHSYDPSEMILVKPTCSTDGFEIWTCQECGQRMHDALTPSSGGHSYTAETVPATCTAPGWTVYTCDGCGDSYRGPETPALGHDLGAWYVYTEPTEDAPGQERQDCSRCSFFNSREIPALEHVHDFRVDYIAEPTCTEWGYTHLVCACGEETESNLQEPLGHEYRGGMCIRCGLENPFEDVKAGDYFFDPVLWALDNGITAGTSATAFSPSAPCTRGQVVTFLWRVHGQPQPESQDNPFTDVNPGDYFYQAVLWAVENGITAGTGNGQFSPYATCTRAQVVTFLWRDMGQPDMGSSEVPFTDVPAGIYFHTPVLWALENGITSGTGNGQFSPNTSCTRGQVVTFLYRAFVNQ